MSVGARQPEFGFEAYGVRVSLSVDPPELLSRVSPLLPPGWSRSSPGAGPRFALTRVDGAYRVSTGEAALLTTVDFQEALGFLDAQIRAYVAFHSRRIFVHAAVAALDDKAIVIPGRSFSGKTTLAAALVAAGATYYSDEFAVLDADGLVHPYPRPLSIRVPGSMASGDHPVESLGGSPGKRPIEVALIVITHFQPGALWTPRRRAPADGALALLANTIPARTRPREAMSAIAQAANCALVLEGDRGEAADTTPAILSAVAQATDAPTGPGLPPVS